MLAFATLISVSTALRGENAPGLLLGAQARLTALPCAALGGEASALAQGSGTLSCLVSARLAVRTLR